jgi:hypothetical protein
MSIFGNRCHICGSGPVKRYSTRNHVNMNGDVVGSSTEEYWTKLLQCDECHQWTCPDCWDENNGIHKRCTACVPAWQRKIRDAERAERERIALAEKERDRIIEERFRRERELREAEYRRKEEKESLERKCHICWIPGDYSSKKCNKCQQWTCSKHLYLGICKNCAERL